MNMDKKEKEIKETEKVSNQIIKECLMPTKSYGDIPERRTGYRCNLCDQFGFRNEGKFYEDFGGWVHYRCRAVWIRQEKEEQRWELEQDRMNEKEKR